MNVEIYVKIGAMERLKVITIKPKDNSVYKDAMGRAIKSLKERRARRVGERPIKKQKQSSKNTKTSEIGKNVRSTKGNTESEEDQELPDVNAEIQTPPGNEEDNLYYVNVDSNGNKFLVDPNGNSFLVNPNGEEDFMEKLNDESEYPDCEGLYTGPFEKKFSKCSLRSENLGQRLPIFGVGQWPRSRYSLAAVLKIFLIQLLINKIFYNKQREMTQ